MRQVPSSSSPLRLVSSIFSRSRCRKSLPFLPSPPLVVQHQQEHLLSISKMARTMASTTPTIVKTFSWASHSQSLHWANCDLPIPRRIMLPGQVLCLPPIMLSSVLHYRLYHGRCTDMAKECIGYGGDQIGYEQVDTLKRFRSYSSDKTTERRLSLPERGSTIWLREC